DAAVDDDASVENLVAFLALLLTPEDAAERCQGQQVTLIGSDDEGELGHEHHDQDLKKTLRAPFGNAVADDQCEEVGAADSEKTSNGSADEPLQTHHAQLPFEDDDRRSDQCADTRIHIAGQTEGLNDVASNRYNDEKKKTYKNEIHGIPPRGCSMPVCPNH